MDIQAIYERQSSRVYRIAMLYLRNIQDAEDAVQTVFLKYMEKNVTFCDLEHEKAWFITVARNYCKDALRNFWRRKVDFGELPERIEEETEDNIILYILQLSPKYREVLYLYYYEEYSVREMSRILHRKESTIQTQLANARSGLKKIMERKGAQAK